MTDAEARDLARRAQAGDMAARDQLVMNCEPLIRLVARDWSRAFPGGAKDYATGWDDLKQECVIALMYCIGQFNTTGPVPFLSYARHRMRSTLFNMLKHRLRRRKRVEKAEALGCLQPEPAADPLHALMRKRELAWAYMMMNHYRSDGTITDRQYEVLRGKIVGKTYTQMGEELDCSPRTVCRDLTAVRKTLANEDS